MENKKYDVGVLGLWSGCNYGSIATYYALNRILVSMGKSVLMIDKPILADVDVERTETHSRRFANEHYDISKQYRLNEMSELNELCDGFVIGSDQVWNYGISKNFGKLFYLDFADDDKKKIAYAVSFGHGVDFAPPEERLKIAEYMSRFDGISVREADGVKICRDQYDINAQQVLDPVFLADPKIYDELIAKSSHKETEPFIAAYILDPTPEKREALLHVSKELGGIKIVNLLDGLPWLFEKNKKLIELPNCVDDLQVEDWLYYLSHAEFVVTDSCHGASFALIFRKNFIPITNGHRGVSRFNSLTQLFHIEDRLVTDPKVILQNKHLLDPIDYGVIDTIMTSERARCAKWLKTVLNEDKKKTEQLQRRNFTKPNYITLSRSVKYRLDPKLCTGCSACANVCPTNAITMVHDSEGFLKPDLDGEKCVNCGLCSRKCIALAPEYKNTAEPKCFAMMASDEIRKKSSSGGMFTVAAEYILDNGGYVCGAAYRDDFTVEHIIIGSKEEMYRLRGSKYMQSDPSSCYKDIKALLEDGKTVLFTGMPCQVAGLYSFLGKKYETLYTIDILCHGITSSKVFEKYHRDVLNGKELQRLEFKEKEPWGWHAGVNAYFTDGTKYSKPLETDMYFIAYLKSIAKNTACGTCVVNRLPRQGDMTIGDFWGIGKHDPDMNDGKGTSVVLVNNEKAQRLFDALTSKMQKLREEPLSVAIAGNHIIERPYRLHKNRDMFFENFDRFNFSDLTMGCFNDNLFDIENAELMKNVPKENMRFYFLAKTAAENCGSRKIVTWIRSERFENILKKFFGKDVAFGVSMRGEAVRPGYIEKLSALKNKSGEYYLVSIDRRYDEKVYRMLGDFGYKEIKDFVFYSPKPVVLENYDLSKGNYHDKFGNTVSGSGIVGRIVFRGGNNYISFGSKIAGLEKLNIDLTSNSTIEIGNECRFLQDFKIQTLADNGFSEIRIKNNCRFLDGLIRLYNSPYTSGVSVGEHCTFESNIELHANAGKKIIIGRDCMFSHDVDLWAGDGHSIFNVKTGENINSVYEKLPEHKNRIVIGEHVWIAKGAFIMHGTDIGNGSIIGAKSVVKGKFPNNCSVAGNPAKILSKDVAWSRDMVTEDIRSCGNNYVSPTVIE